MNWSKILMIWFNIIYIRFKIKIFNEVKNEVLSLQTLNQYSITTNKKNMWYKLEPYIKSSTLTE